MSLRIAYSSVRLTEAQACAYMFALVNQEFAKEGYDCWLTSAKDGRHSQDSLHYNGLGLDFRTKHVDRTTMEKIYKRIKQFSSPIFDVVWEDQGGDNEHLHVEYHPD